MDSTSRNRGVAMVAMLAVLGYGVFNDPQEINGTFARAQPAEAQPVPGVANEDWPSYARTEGGVRYSPLTQINDENVGNLQVAWTYRTGDFRSDNDSGETTNEVTPIKVGDTLFLCTPHQFLDALDASTGRLIWHFQTTHHDLWDMDVPAQPSLMDVRLADGRTVPAVYVLTKTGNVFVLDRRNGEPIVPITEKPVPQRVAQGYFLLRDGRLYTVLRMNGTPMAMDAQAAAGLLGRLDLPAQPSALKGELGKLLQGLGGR